MLVASFICLLVVPLAFESVQTSSPSVPLSALKRQKKSLAAEVAAESPFLKSQQHSSFRERQHEYIKPSSTKRSTEGSPSSFFSERVHQLESQGKGRKTGRFSNAMLDDDDDDVENRSPLPQYNIYYKRQQQQPDPWFPALEARKRYDVDRNREAIDSALKHMTWQRLNKRLVKLNDARGPYLDRGERRIRMAKRTPPKTLEDKDLEAILSDDVSPGTDSNDVAAGQKSTVNKSSTSKTVVTNTDKQLLLPPPLTTVASVDKTTLKSNQGPASKKEKETKGRQWVPLDSEPTLRSKKSWDDYFGIDKRSSHSYPGQWQVDSSYDNNDDNNNDDDNDDERMVSDQELRDFLMQWYADKMLSKTALKADAEGPEGASENKMKKRKISDMVEEEEDGRRLNGKEQEDVVEDNNDDDESDRRWGDPEAVSVNIPFEDVDDRLRQIEDDILMEATQILEKGAQISHSKEKGNDNNPALTENEVVSRLKAAFNVEKMRDAIEDFQDSYSKMQPQQNYGIGNTAVVADDFEDADDDKKKKKKKKRDRNDDKKRDDSDVDKKKHKKSMKKKSIAGQPAVKSAIRTTSSKVSAAPTGQSSEVAMPLTLADSHEEEEAQCPVISGAMDYCQELSDALGEMGRLLARPCVKHMLCYTCDNIPTACDSIFLQDAEAICREHFHCQAVASAMRSVFLSNQDEFRHVNRPLCGSDQCLLRLLLTK